MSSSQKTKLISDYREALSQIEKTMDHLDEMSKLMLDTAQLLLNIKSELTSQFKNLKKSEEEIQKDGRNEN